MAAQGRTGAPGLSQRDIDVLTAYAKSGNRELYWNYLAQHEGSDGYGKLALGVARNDKRYAQPPKEARHGPPVGVLTLLGSTSLLLQEGRCRPCPDGSGSVQCPVPTARAPAP